MTHVTISFTENNSKAVALLNYLKTLDFIKISTNTDWWDELSQENISDIKEGLHDIEIGNTYSDKDVRLAAKQRILEAKE